MKEKDIDIEKNSKETREERFKRVAARRTNDILRRIRILGNCSNRSGYAYKEEDIQKIFSAIEAELRSAKVLFTNRRKTNFQL
jgi:hypothetical protein